MKAELPAFRTEVRQTPNRSRTDSGNGEYEALRQVRRQLRRGSESIIKPVDMTLVAVAEADYVKLPEHEIDEEAVENPEKIADLIAKLESEMREAAKRFEFERAAELRDKARALRAKITV